MLATAHASKFSESVSACLGVSDADVLAMSDPAVAAVRHGERRVFKQTTHTSVALQYPCTLWSTCFVCRWARGWCTQVLTRLPTLPSVAVQWAKPSGELGLWSADWTQRLRAVVEGITAARPKAAAV